ncbi:hypothetical protein [Actinacidiphila glaucinigra]|uniref:hypothetical protein n=1 Tax=Actinacidiphila glaucinigra TaxID=235986 RepID=UPI0035E2F8B4
MEVNYVGHYAPLFHRTENQLAGIHVTSEGELINAALNDLAQSTIATKCNTEIK